MQYRMILFTPLLAVLGCTVTKGTTTTDTSSPGEGEGAEGEGSEGEGEGEGSAFSNLTDDDGFMLAMDLAVSSDAIYAVGTDENGEAAIVSIDPDSGELRTLYTGDPLVLPSGVCLSADDTALYIADPVADITGDGVTNGGVFRFSLSDYNISEVGVAGTVDMPSDVTLTYGGNEAYIAGFTPDGVPGIFSYIIDSGAVYTRVTGAPMVEPVQLDANADGTLLYVLDALGTGSQANVWAFITSSWTATEPIYQGFDTSFPGGLSINPAEDTAYITTYPGGLVATQTDGSGFEVLDTLDMLEMPTGVFALYNRVYVADGGDLGDLFVLSL